MIQFGILKMYKKLMCPRLYLTRVKHFTSEKGTHHFLLLPSGCSIDQRPICIDSYSGSLTTSRRKDYLPCGGALSDPFDLCSSSILMQLPNASLHRGSLHPHADRRPSTDEADGTDYVRPHERVSPSGTFMGESEVSVTSLSAVFTPLFLLLDYSLGLC